MKKNLVFVLVFLALTPFVNAELLSVYGVLCKNDTASIDELYLTRGTGTEHPYDGDYTYTFVDSEETQLLQNRFSEDFILYSDPPAHEECTSLSIQVPYIQDMDSLILSHNDKELLRYEFSDLLCNLDYVCNNFENSISCPSDCPLEEGDGFCSSDSTDGICDPDCSEDLDCIKQEQNTTEPDTGVVIGPPKQDGSYIQTIIGVIIALALTILVVFLIFKYMRTSKE